ncbi:helix-turn-helix domain-containing protein [Isoptericola sp. F-RaC21]|uniref:TetR/AcrR family transcriptional regulator n=1 Tax=Isoptericola sp. F-RaC21 TaxID=3141452 RepID=UPI00315BF0B8
MVDQSVRADAARNAERLVEAARAALAETGLELTTRELAQRAGVGLGTVHRRIPSMRTLLARLLTESIDEMTRQAGQASEAPDAWSGFSDFAETYVHLRATSCGLHEALAGQADLDLATPLDQLARAVQRLVSRAQRDGAIRTDIDWRDVRFVLASAISTDHTIGLTAAADQSRRNLRIILDGLRPRP